MADVTQSVMDEIKAACPLCRKGVPVLSHLGGAEYIHSVALQGQHMVTACQASGLWVQYKDILFNGR